jgi:hypothetical protein
MLDEIIVEPGAVYVMDRAYLDFQRLHRVKNGGAFFVTRAKKNAHFERVYSHAVDKSSGVRSDQTVKLVSFYPAQEYPDHLRRVRFVDPDMCSLKLHR